MRSEDERKARNSALEFQRQQFKETKQKARRKPALSRDRIEEKATGLGREKASC